MRLIFFSVIGLMLAGCSDVVTSRFETLGEAERKHALDRGWLPPILPKSARTIVEKNNLDLNIGHGSFQYDLTERSNYIGHLTQSGAVSRREQDMDIFMLSSNGSSWKIELPRDVGQGRYEMKQGL